MNEAWWGKEVSQPQRQGATPPNAFSGASPELVVATRDEVFEELKSRILSFTPEWTNRREGEAGIALAHLFTEEMEPVLQRANLLPKKAFVEFLRTAGVQPLPPTPAQALLQFMVSDGATQSVPVLQGFQVSGGNQVIFETNADLYAAPGKIKELYALEKGFYRSIDPTTTNVAFQPFGRSAKPGAAFFIGIAANAGVVLGPQLSLGFQVEGSAGQPPPVSSGGLVPLPVPLAPLLRWNVLDGATFQPVEVMTDETGGLLQSGVITLALPDEWNPGIPPGAPDTTPLLWLRLQIAYGAYPQSPVLLAITLNMVRATAVQTFYNEVLTPVPNTNGAVMSLSSTPVLPKSLFLTVDDTADISFTQQGGTSGGATTTARRWQEVDDLAQFGPDDEVYVLDSGTGEVTFGNGIHGKIPPPGFRNIVAVSYKVGGGVAGAVGAGKVSGPLTSIPFIAGVTNPLPATGGMDAETQDQATSRGPSEARARGRAVAAADYEILSLRAPGAQVARAHAVPGFHPVFPGTPIAGVVCVFVIPIERGAGPPSASEDTLRAVSEFLSSELAPAGVEVVTAAPLFHRVRVQVSVVIEPGVNRGEAVASVLAQINSYLDPVTGGDDKQGWPFGGTLSYASMARRLLTSVPQITAIPRLNFVVDGVRGAICSDVAISPNSLVWPVQHEVIALAPGDQS